MACQHTNWSDGEVENREGAAEAGYWSRTIDVKQAADTVVHHGP